MKESRRRPLIRYILADFLMSVIAWGAFFYFRKKGEGAVEWSSIFRDENFILGIFLIPLGWVLFYALFDEYTDIYRKSRLQTLVRTFGQTFLGVLFLFFSLILDDVVPNYSTYYKSFALLFLLQFGLILLMRMILLTLATIDVKSGKVSFATIIIGANDKAFSVYKDIIERPKSLGYDFKGFLTVNGLKKDEFTSQLTHLGNLNDIPEVMKKYQVEEVILALEKNEYQYLNGIINNLFDFDHILIKIIPDLYDIMLGHVKMNHVYGAVLIEIEQVIMPRWQRIVKRIFDMLVSLVLLILLAPLYAFIALRVRMSSPGPIFFRQKRIGLDGKPFTIYKFRSMYTNAEDAGPQLSFDGDNRCTPWGAIMRKWRLDELPQFFNVLIGDMSIVGPRPERQFYIDQIMERAPHYKHLLKVRPGITSWGQVKYGYASNVDQMIQRLKFDILYVENRSLMLDFKILFYTVLVVVRGDGK